MLYINMLIIILLVVIAGILAFSKREGWGWFLFVAILIIPFSDHNKENNIKQETKKCSCNLNYSQEKEINSTK